jgi:hypothetical protein
MSAEQLTVNDYRISSEESAELMSAEGSARAEVAQAIVDRLFGQGAEISDVAAAQLLDSAREAKATVAAYRKANDPHAKGSSKGAAQSAKPNGPDAPATLISGVEFMGAITPPEYSVRPLVQRGHLVALTGLTGHGKSTVSAMALAGCLSGRAIGGMRFRKSRALLLAGENPSNAAIQLRGALRHYGVTDAELSQLSVRSGSGRLTDIGGPIFDEAAAKGDHGLVVVDTSLAFFSYDNENDNVQQLQHAKDARRFTFMPGAPGVLLNCHPVKNAGRDNLIPRGGGALMNELDANLTIWNDGETLELGFNKLRGPAFDPMTFHLELQDIGLVDDEGVPILPPVAVPLSESEAWDANKRQNEDENRLLDAMLRFPAHSIAAWAMDCGWISETGNPSKSKVHRILKALDKDKLTKLFRGHWKLTEAGKKEAAK